MRTWLGATLMSQAGAAIALSAVALQRTEELQGVLPDICEHVQTVILGTVAVFEIAGQARSFRPARTTAFRWSPTTLPVARSATRVCYGHHHD